MHTTHLRAVLLAALASTVAACGPANKFSPTGASPSASALPAASVAAPPPSALPPSASASASARLVPPAFPPAGSTHTAKRSVDRIGSASLSPDGRTLITLGVGNVVHRWDLATGKLLGVDDPTGGPGATSRAGAIAALPDRQLARCDGKKLAVFRTDDGAPVRELPPARFPCGTLFATPDGRTLFVASTKGTVDVVDAGTGETRRTLRVDEGYTRVVPSPDGKHAFTLDNANNAFVWDLTTGEKRPLARPNDLRDADFSADGTEIFTIGRPGDTAFIKALVLLDLHERARAKVGPLARVLVAPGGEGSAIVIGGGASGDGFAQLVARDPLVPGAIAKLPSPPERLYAARTAPVVVSVSYEAYIRVFDARTGQLGGMIVPAK